MEKDGKALPRKPTAPSPSQTLDRTTRKFVDHIYEIWSRGADITDLGKIRDQILASHKNVQIQIATLGTVAKIACSLDNLPIDIQWSDFFGLEGALTDDVSDERPRPSKPPIKKRKRGDNTARRLHNLALVAALWSLRVVEHYDWHLGGNAQINLLRSCALRWPHFTKDFCPRLNANLLRRHCEALTNPHVKSLHEAPLQPLRDLNIAALEASEPDPGCLKQWINSQDGAVMIDSSGTLLNQIRPDHFSLYLLQQDVFGVLISRSSQAPETAAQNGHSPQLSPQRAMFAVPNEASPLGDVEDVLNSSARRQSDPTSDSVLGSVSIDNWLESRSEISTLNGLTPESRSSSAATDLSSLVKDTCYVSMPRLDELSADTVDLNPMASCTIAADFVQRHLIWPSLPPSISEHTLNPLYLRLEEQADNDLPPGNNLAEELEFVDFLHSPVTPSSAENQMNRVSDSFMANAQASWELQLPVLDDEVQYDCTDNASAFSPGIVSSDGNASASCASQIHLDCGRTIQEAMHNKYHSTVSFYARLVREDAMNADVGTFRQSRAGWLTDKSLWATLYPGVDSTVRDRGESPEFDEADVLYLTSRQLLVAATENKAMTKPIVVKESFNDSGMHSAETLVSEIVELSPNETVEVISLDADHPQEKSAEGSAVRLVYDCDLTDSTKEALQLKNITKAHCPLFTMIPRFRLLERLTNRSLEGDSTPRKCVCAAATHRNDFNIISSPGAFTGSRIHTLAGVWIRNLGDTVICTFVPQSAMNEPEWEKFAALGTSWSPDQKSRILILEQNDVFIIPPGLKIVYSLHCPTGNLLEGSLFWDECSIIETMNVISWGQEKQLPTKKSERLAILDVVTELCSLVSRHEARFSGFLPQSDFQNTFLDAVSRLRRSFQSTRATV